MKLRAAVPGAPSISAQVNDALRRALAEDEADAASVRRTVRDTRREEWVSYEEALRALKSGGRL